MTKVWLNLPKGRTYDGGATNPSIRLDCEPQFVEGPDTETSWRLCSLSTNRHYDHEWAGGRGFTTGANPTGYTISGLGVDIDLESGTLDPVANLYAVDAFSSREGARDPQSPLAGYQATAGIGGSPDRFAPRTAVSEELHVEPGRTYVAYFQNAAAGYYQTPNASRGENPGAEAGWTLGGSYGSRFVHPVGFGGDDWNLDNEFKWIPLNVYGWPNPLPPAPNPDPPPRPPRHWSATWARRRGDSAILSPGRSLLTARSRCHSRPANMTRAMPFTECRPMFTVSRRNLSADSGPRST